MSEDKRDKIQKLVDVSNVAYKRAEQMQDIFNDCLELFIEESQGASNPFKGYSYKLNDLMKEIRHSLAQGIIRIMQRDLYPNIPMEERIILDAMEVALKDKFDAKFVMNYIDGKYKSMAAEFSMVHLIKSAQTLIPYDHGRKPEPREITKGRTLHLHMWLQDHYIESEKFPWDRIENVNALETLGYIIVEGDDPVHCNKTALSGILQSAGDRKELYGYKIEISGGLIHSVKLFKNGRFDVEFNREEDARTIALEIIKRIPIR